jgi:hypothetical protein
VDSSKIVDGSINSADLGNAIVATEHLQDGAVTTEKIASASVDASKLTNTSVTLAKLSANSVDTSKLVDEAVTMAKLAEDSVDGSKIVDGSVGAGDLANSAVISMKLADGAVTQEKLAVNSVGTSQIVDGSITSPKLASNFALSLPFNYAFCQIQSNGQRLPPPYSCVNVKNISRLDIGTYVIHFETPFSSHPAVIVTPLGGTGSWRTILSTNSVNILFSHHKQYLYDVPFNFVAIG